MPSADKIFLLSPARIGGARATMLFREQAAFDLAVRVREGRAPIGKIYEFISGLYFRGKLAYAKAFGAPPEGQPAVLIIVPGLGLVSPEMILDVKSLRATGEVDVSELNESFREPLLRDAEELNRRSSGRCQVVLLGSIASEKYTEPLLSVFGERLLFPEEFVGRGDMSRGGLMLRCCASGEELSYVRLDGATRRGRRPPKLERLPRKPGTSRL